MKMPRLHSRPAAGGRPLCATLFVFLASTSTWAQTSTETPEILVIGRTEILEAGQVMSSDTASLLSGIDWTQGGGVSGLPMIRGLGDDRLRTLVNGVPMASACPMHMNPPLSYIAPSNVDHIDILPGVTPVRLGGDSIGGTIQVESALPVFAASDAALATVGRVSSFYRSNSSALGGSAAASLASTDFSLGYQGAISRAGDYHDGAGDRINASGFQTQNNELNAAYRNGPHLVEVTTAWQHIPYQGFPNSDMDMTGNVSASFNAHYTGGHEWGELHLNTYYDHVSHDMDGNGPDRYPPSVSITGFGEFPTHERGQDYGYRADANIALSAQDTLRMGNELHAQTLDDRWPGAPMGMMFDYVSLNDASRRQWGTFAEWERRWDGHWTGELGVRNDTVHMNSGPVQGYDGLDATAVAFNAMNRARTDVNIDATFQVRFQPDDNESYILGLARKNRSPNLYERYAWGTNTMGTVTWFGDGNGYTGNPNLKRETADTASFAANLHDARAWQLRLTPYFTNVQNYIGVIPLCGSGCTEMPGAQLLFVNQRARIYGADANGSYTVSDSTVTGTFKVTGAAGYVHGEDLTTRTPLYHLMPIHGSLALEHEIGSWSSALTLHMVGRKTAVDPIRHEPPTAGYSLFDVRTAYEWRHVRLDFAITNVLDRQYDNPLGGTWQSTLYPPGYGGTTFRPLPATGRSLDTGVSVKF